MIGIKNERIKLIETVLISFLFCFACFITLKVHYETNDDTYMNLIAAGAFGKDSQYLLWINILYGYILKGFYLLLPSVNWYLVFMLAMNALSIAVITYCIVSRMDSLVVLIVAIIANIILAKDFYVELNFTKTAGICAIAGCLLLVEALKKQDSLLSSISVLLLFLAVAQRYLCVVMLFPFFVAYFVYCLLEKEIDWKNRHMVSSILVLVLGLAVLIGADSIAYSNAEWKNVKPTISELSKIVDYGMIHYDAKADEYQSVGMSKEVAEMINHVLVADTDTITAELLKNSYEIEKEISGNGLSLSEDAFNKLGNRLNVAFSEHSLPVISLVLACMLIVIGRKQQVILVLGNALLVFAEYWYMACKGRVLWRVEVSIWIVVISVTLMLLKRELHSLNRDSITRKFSIACSVVFVLGMLFYMDAEWRSKDRYVTYNQNSSIEFIQSTRKDAGYYVGLELDPVPNVYKISKTNYQGYFSHYGVIGSWMCIMPNVKDAFVKAGISNPVRALIERDDVFYVGSEEDATRVCNYLQYVNHATYYLEQIDEKYEKAVWKIK